MTLVSAPDWDERQLDAYRRAYEAGHAAALADAFAWCQQAAVPAPPWLTTAILVVDYMRYSMIEDARDHDLTWEDSYQFAADYLAPTPARGTEATMRRTWGRVSARMRQMPGRYALTSAFCAALDRLEPPQRHSRTVVAQYTEMRRPKK